MSECRKNERRKSASRTNNNPNRRHALPEDPQTTAVEPLSLRHQLQARLEALSYDAFCLVVRQLLYQSGYTSVHAVGRLFEAQALPQPGRNPGRREAQNWFNPRHGGVDLIALSHTDLATSLTLVQVKQYRPPVPRRFIDELRGAMLRLGAEQGLLITCSRFSALARDAAGGSHMRPVHLVDGALLIEMLLTRRIGLRCETVGRGRQRWLLDVAFFNALEERVRRATPEGTPSHQECSPSVPNSEIGPL